MGVLLVAGIVLCSFSVMFGRDITWLDRNETRWLLALQLILLMLAVQSPNIYITIAICWVAIHPWIAHLGYSYGPLQFAPDRTSVYYPLYSVLWWVAIYTILNTTSSQWSWRLVAWTLLVWSLFNTLVSFYQEHFRLPRMFLDERTPQFPISPGLLGGSFMLSFMSAIGALSTAFIIYIDHYYFLFPILFILITFSLRTVTLSPMLSVSIPCFLFLTTLNPYYFIVMCCILGLGICAIFSTTHDSSLSSRLPGWKVAIKLSVSTWFIGIGLGSWNAVTNPVDTKEQEGVLWRNLHNDWLQSLVELGPIPSMCAIALLTTSWISMFHSPTFPPSQLYGLLMVSSIAVYAIGYFPMRDHTPSILLAVGLVLMGK